MGIPSWVVSQWDMRRKVSEDALGRMTKAVRPGMDELYWQAGERWLADPSNRRRALTHLRDGGDPLDLSRLVLWDEALDVVGTYAARIEHARHIHESWSAEDLQKAFIEMLERWPQ